MSDRRSHPRPLPVLPVEVYQDIFLRATGPPECEYDNPQFWQSEYTPHAGCQVISKKSNAPLRCQLLLVCQLWHSVAQKVAYETIFVGKHATSLLAALTRSAKKNNGVGYGQFVRKFVFCAREKKGVNKTTIARLLAACPQVTTIIREAQDFCTFPTSLPSFSSLHRLDWWSYHQPPEEYWIETYADIITTDPKPTTKNANTTSNDLYLIRDIIDASPNLEYLSIGVEICSQPWKGEHTIIAWSADDSLVVPVTTFRLQTTVPWITSDINRWTFPNLKNLIINPHLPVKVSGSCHCNECKASSPFPHSLLTDQVRKIEFTGLEGWGVDINHGRTNIVTILSGCNNTTELTFAFATDVLRLIATSPTIRLRDLHTLRIDLIGWTIEWGIKQWEGITLARLPSLRRVVLVGDEKSALQPDTFPAPSLYQFLENLSKRMGPKVTFLGEDGQLCSFDQSVHACSQDD